MILLPATRGIFAAVEPVDMRRSFDVLLEIARRYTPSVHDRAHLTLCRSPTAGVFSRMLATHSKQVLLPDPVRERKGGFERSDSTHPQTLRLPISRTRHHRLRHADGASSPENSAR